MDNQAQIDYWNGESGRRWAEQDELMARLLRPIGEALLDHARLDDCNYVMDIGCGGGSQSRLLASRLDADARVLGVDISEPLLEVARANNARRDGEAAVDYLLADASEYAFAEGQFDGLFSRFGVMFFAEPAAAFANLRRALGTGGKLAFACWQGMDRNDWARIPVQAALQFVPLPENMVPDAHAPGPFAFADAARVERILQEAGFSDIRLISHERDMRMGERPSLAESVREMASVGPVQRLLVGQDEQTLAQVFAALESVLAPHYRDGALQLPAAAWFVTAAAGN